MLCLDFLSIKARTGSYETTVSTLALLVQHVFATWISFAAAGVFLAALTMAIFQLISVLQLFYVYAGITAITLLLAFLLYFARRNS
jgi:hypothetical protein